MTQRDLKTVESCSISVCKSRVKLLLTTIWSKEHVNIAGAWRQCNRLDWIKIVLTNIVSKRMDVLNSVIFRKETTILVLSWSDVNNCDENYWLSLELLRKATTIYESRNKSRRRNETLETNRSRDNVANVSSITLMFVDRLDRPVSKSLKADRGSPEHQQNFRQNADKNCQQTRENPVQIGVVWTRLRPLPSSLLVQQRRRQLCWNEEKTAVDCPRCTAQCSWTNFLDTILTIH